MRKSQDREVNDDVLTQFVVNWSGKLGKGKAHKEESRGRYCLPLKRPGAGVFIFESGTIREMCILRAT